MSDNEPIWQVNVDGKIYETDLEMLKQWIAEGQVGPTDPVRKGTLSWIAANRAPALRSARASPRAAPPENREPSRVSNAAAWTPAAPAGISASSSRTPGPSASAWAARTCMPATWSTDRPWGRGGGPPGRRTCGAPSGSDGSWGW